MEEYLCSTYVPCTQTLMDFVFVGMFRFFICYCPKFNNFYFHKITFNEHKIKWFLKKVNNITLYADFFCLVYVCI